MTAHAHIVDHAGNVVGHVCGSDNVLLRTGTVEPRWCPRCRMQLLHRLEVRGDSQPSYYDPYAAWACRRCTGWKEKPRYSQPAGDE